jgi:hypothetical protein
MATIRRVRTGGRGSELLSVQVRGLGEMVAGLESLGVEVEDLKDGFEEIARQGSVLAARYAPKRSGRLAGDIRGNRARSKAVITAGRASVPYAGPINYGWARRGIKPALFMQRADQELQPYALRRLEQDINSKIQSKGLK